LLFLILYYFQLLGKQQVFKRLIRAQTNSQKELILPSL